MLISGDSPGRVIGPIGRIVKALAMSPFASPEGLDVDLGKL